MNSITLKGLRYAGQVKNWLKGLSPKEFQWRVTLQKGQVKQFVFMHSSINIRGMYDMMIGMDWLESYKVANLISGPFL